MPFDGLRVLSLESRRAGPMEKLIRDRGGVPFVAPSMREVPLEDNLQALAFAERLFAGEFDMVIFLTGVGAKQLTLCVATRYNLSQFIQALRQVAIVVRGPKPAAFMRELQVPIAVTVPEPNTWRELLTATAHRPERRIAVQEYGRVSQELIDGLRTRGAEVTQVPVYQWDLPEDTTLLRAATHKLAAGDFDAAMFTTSIQVPHLLRIAAEEGIEPQVRAGLANLVIASIGPTTTETLIEHGLPPDFEPTHPKMGFLVNELSDAAHLVLQSKRA